MAKSSFHPDVGIRSSYSPYEPHETEGGIKPPERASCLDNLIKSIENGSIYSALGYDDTYGEEELL